MAIEVTNDPQVELERCAASKLYFASNYYWARTERNTFEPLGKLWNAQVATVKAIDEFGWIYNLKARKLGISTIGCAIDDWNFLFKPHCRVHLFSQRDEDAANLLERCRQAYWKLPSWMQGQKIVTNNTHTFSVDFGDGDVRILQAYSSNPDAGRSESCQHAHVDEFAIVENSQQEDFWAAVEPSVVPGGTLHIMTTGRGSQNYAAELWKNAIAGRSSVYPIFLPYNTRPDRDEEWYEEKKLRTPIRKLKQEYPRNWQEALVDPEKAVFPEEVRQKNWYYDDYLTEGLPGRTYYKAWDLGYKVDAAASIVMDVTTLPFKVVHLALYEHVPYTALQEIANDLHKRFRGMDYIESNAMGEAFIQNLNFPAIGHFTGPKSKPEGISRLQLLLEQGNFKYNPQIYPGNVLDDQLSSYMWEDINLVQDLVMAASICAYYAYDRVAYALNVSDTGYDSPEKDFDKDLDPLFTEADEDRKFLVRQHYRDRYASIGFGDNW